MALRRIGLLLALVGLAAGGAGLWVRARLAAPYRGFSEPEVFVELAAGSSVAEIGTQLTAAGVVSDPLTFRLATRLSGVDRRLQAGEYRFTGDATAFEVVSRLARGDVYTHSVTFPEGLTIREMAVIFERSGLGPAKEFERAAENVALAAAFDPKTRTLEGYLFPDTYALPRRAGAVGTIQAMVKGFEEAFDGALVTDAAALGLDARKVVTLASLIEKETARADERPLVSAVYHNRLRRGMALQCDPTVIYALMLQGRWTGNLRRDDLALDSPYNTYRYSGLPPGPIASPGRAALEAAVRPAIVPYLYFVSRNNGSHEFAVTLAEHNRNVARWQKGGQ
jgi:UPF0755 protein